MIRRIVPHPGMAWYLGNADMTDKNAAVKPTPITKPGEPHPEQTGQTTQDASSEQKDPPLEGDEQVQPNADILTEGSVRAKRPRIQPGDVPRRVRY